MFKLVRNIQELAIVLLFVMRLQQLYLSKQNVTEFYFTGIHVYSVFDSIDSELDFHVIKNRLL